MDETERASSQLIVRIKNASLGDRVTSGAVALLNVVPYAGGAVASIIGEFASQRRFEKVCEVLSDLNARLEAQRLRVEDHLTKDQVVEVVHEAAAAAATASDQHKIDALKRGLGYAFASSDPFDTKQLHLKILRELTSIEMQMLHAVYSSSDPYAIQFRDPTQELSDLSTSITQISLLTYGAKADGYWEPESNIESDSLPSLLAFLVKEAGSPPADAEAALRRLDGQGLTAAVPHFQSRRCVILKWIRRDPHFAVLQGSTSSLGLVKQTVHPTALQAAKTAFGRQFLEHFGA